VSFLVSIALGLALLGSGSDSDALLDRAITLARGGELDRAYQLLEEGRRNYPADYRFARELAGVEYRRKRFASAKSYLRHALRSQPGDDYSNEFLGTLFLLEENLPATLKYWNRAGKPLLGSVEFAPVPRIDPILRARTFPLSAGQLLTTARLQRSLAEMDLLGIFASAQFDLAPAAQDRYDLTIRTTPIAQPLRGWPGRLLPLLRSIPYQGVHLDAYNIGERAANFTSLWRWDRQKRRVALEYSTPLRGWRSRVNIDGRDEIWDLAGDRVVLRRAAANIDFSRNLTERLRWTTGGGVVGRQFRESPSDATFSSGWSLHIDNRFDYLLWTWPDYRFRIDSWGLLRAGRILTAFPSRLAAFEGGARATWHPGAKGDTYTMTSEFRSGAAYGNVPLDELFILGMERDNDLWLRGRAGTRDGRKGSAPMGTRYVLQRNDLMRRLFRIPLVRIEAGPFFDTGWMSDPSGRFGSRRWLYDTGVQATIRTIGNVRFLAVYGRSLREGRGVFYTAVAR
jgi:hypothetical protein